MRAINDAPTTFEELNEIKRRILRAEKSHESLPSASELLKAYHELIKKNKIKPNKNLEKLLIKRSVRTISGVSIITVLTKPYPCPGKCIYCPSDERMPKSYLADEPAAGRALQLKFDPFEQVRRRIETLKENGHPTDKIELIVKGGTWNAYPLSYQYWFILRCFEAGNSNCHSEQSEESLYAGNYYKMALRDPSAAPQDDSSINLDKVQVKLKKAQKKNEAAKHRIIGLTLETRPDFINPTTIWQMREQGCTRIELGVQTTNDKTLQLVKRGHTTLETKKATQLLKNYGFKVDYHLMPQLPCATPKEDLKMMLTIFSDPSYRPDMIKIYPCTVIKNSELYTWLKEGKYKTYSNRKLIDMLKSFKKEVPYYVRISRLIRDIPSPHIEAGNKMTNLRQVIQKEMQEEGLKCKCLRCREVGHSQSKVQSLKSKVQLFVEEYEASGGKEYFLSFEDSDRNVVFAFCRLRICHCEETADEAVTKQSNRSVASKKIASLPSVARNDSYDAYIRELHTYGRLVEIGKKNSAASQHKGLGKKLMAEAIKICKKNKINKLAVIAGVGVRDYYRKIGFKLEKTYMVKKI